MINELILYTSKNCTTMSCHNWLTFLKLASIHGKKPCGRCESHSEYLGRCSALQDFDLAAARFGCEIVIYSLYWAWPLGARLPGSRAFSMYACKVALYLFANILLSTWMSPWPGIWGTRTPDPQTSEPQQYVVNLTFIPFHTYLRFVHFYLNYSYVSILSLQL